MRKERFEPGTTLEAGTTLASMCSRMSWKFIGLCLFVADNNELLFGAPVFAEVHPPLAHFSKYMQLTACWTLSIQYMGFSIPIKKMFHNVHDKL